MRSWDAHQIARAAGARLLREPEPAGEGPEPAGEGPERAGEGPERATIDSRDAGPGTLFVGLPGEHVDGGSFAAAALRSGAWGVPIGPAHVESLTPGVGTVLVADDPLIALQALSNAWRRKLDTTVIAVTGSTGKTSTKDLLLGVLSPYRLTVASHANLNTEIGLPLQILAAPVGTEALVLEMGMRGPGQIGELARIAEPDVGVIVSIGQAHLELLGTIEAIAAAKGELIAALAPGATVVVPAGEPLLEPHLRDAVQTVTFGPGGDVQLAAQSDTHVEIDAQGDRLSFEVDFTEPYLRHDLLAAVAAARAIGVQPGGRLELKLSPGRGQRRLLPDGVTLIDGAYNANPMSMRAALDVLAATHTSGRRIAVLGDMLELGPGAARLHQEIGAHAQGIADLLITVGPLSAAMANGFHGEHRHATDAAAAAALLPALLHAGDVVLVKASNGVGLKLVCETLTTAALA